MRHPELTARLAKFDAERPQSDYATHLDAWMNDVTGIGTSRDKVTSTVFQATTGAMLPSQLEDLYHNDDVASRICDKLPKTALRRNWTLQDADLQKKMERLNARRNFRKAAIFGRLHGGGVIIMGASGPSNQPLSGDGVRSLFVADRYTVSPWKFYTNSAEEKYGQPELYRISRPMFAAAGGSSVVPDPGEIIHESRLILFPGAETSPRRWLANGGWDDSVLQRVYQVVQAYGLTWASITHLLQDAAQGVYAMKDLWNMIVGGNKAAVEERMKTIDEQRSSARAILIDADDEKFTRVPTPFSGIPELVDRISERLASAAELPLTVLMGSSPAGMNATGESDLEIFYGMCEDWCIDVNTPAVQKLAFAMGEKEPISVTYPPLWLPSADEIAKARYTTAQADNIYHTMGLKSEKIITSRFPANGWSPDMVVTEEDIEDPAERSTGAPSETEGASGTAVGTHHFSPKYGR